MNYVPVLPRCYATPFIFLRRPIGSKLFAPKPNPLDVQAGGLGDVQYYQYSTLYVPLFRVRSLTVFGLAPHDPI